MEYRIDLKKDLPMLAIASLPILYGLFFWSTIPDQVPLHWNMSGEIDSYGSKYVAMFLPLGIYLFMVVIPFIDPRRVNYGIFSRSYYGIRLGIILFLSILNVLTLSNVGSLTQSPTAIVIGVLGLFAFIGNYLRGVKSNWFVGIKTPWTLDNELVWNKTHRFASNLWFWGSILAIGVVFFVPSIQKIHVLNVLALVYH